MSIRVERSDHTVVEWVCDTLDYLLNRLRYAGHWPRVVGYEVTAVGIVAVIEI